MNVGPRPTLKRRRDAGHKPAAFRGRRTTLWLGAGILGLIILAIAPLALPQTAGLAHTLGTLLALTFLIASACLGIGMGGRSFPVATVITLLLFGISQLPRLAFAVDGLFILAVIAGFAIFALAGFNLVFLLEEMVFDAHRLMHLRHPAWSFVPTVVVTSVAAAIPWYNLVNQSDVLITIWWAAVVGTMILGGWWFLAAFNDLPNERVLPELHLFVVGIMGAAGLAELIDVLAETGPPGTGTLLVPIVAYMALIGTWVYVSYTTLQRTHFLLGRQNTLPWISLLLAATYAILVHVQVQYQAQAHSQDVLTQSLQSLVRLRVGYLMLGLWVGVSFYVLRNFWRMLRAIRHWAILGRVGRLTVGRVSRVAEEVLYTERKIGVFVGDALWKLEGVLPGRHAQRPRGWDLDLDSGIQPIVDAEE